MAKPKTSLLPVAFLALGSLALWIWRNSRFSIRSPHYRVLRKEGPLEWREYPHLFVATTASTSGGNGMNDSFQRLLRFISGSNAERAKIEMTTPVLLSHGAAPESMSFILPAELGLVSTPRPADFDVKLERLAGGRFAVARFSGAWSRERAEQELDRLRAWISSLGFSTTGESYTAHYDPPWTPPFLRRNEVLLRGA